MLQIFPSHFIHLIIGLCPSPGPSFQNYHYPPYVEKRPYPPSIVSFFINYVHCILFT